MLLIAYADLNTCKLVRNVVTDCSWTLQNSKTWSEKFEHKIEKIGEKSKENFYKNIKFCRIFQENLKKFYQHF